MLFFCIKVNAFETYLTGIGKNQPDLPSETGHQFSSTEQKPLCQHVEMQHISCSCSSYFILRIKAVVVGGEKNGE